MPDIILEENEGETLIERRAAMAVREAAQAAVNHGSNNHNQNANRNAANAERNNNGNGAIAAAAADPGQGNLAAAANGAGDATTTTTMTGTYIASQIVRLIGVDVRALFQRLGVNSAVDIKFMRERDLEVLPRISSIQKRKVWGILKFVATDHKIEIHTTMNDIAKSLNETKQRNRDASTNNNTANSSSTATARIYSTAKQKQLVQVAAATQNSALVPVVQMVHSSKLDPFDGSHQKWLCWKNKTWYSLSQTVLGPMIREGEEGESIAKKWPGKDHLLFNVLAEAIVDGSAKHLIAKAQKQSARTAEAQSQSSRIVIPTNRITTTMPTAASGRILWQMLMTEYTKGHMAFRILSDARQRLQKLCLVAGSNENNDYNNENGSLLFQTQSASDYVQAFRHAKDTLEEYQQALPDQFLASTFVENIQDARLDAVKKQLLRDIANKNLSLESCMTELLMADHMMQIRQTSSAHAPLPPAAGKKKRNHEEQEENDNQLLEHEQEDRKRLKADNIESNSSGGGDM